MSANVFPAEGYLSSNSRTTADMQAASETENSGIREMIGAAPEGSTLAIASNIITPLNNACVFPVDAAGGGTISLINVTNVRDGQVIYLHCVSSSNPITITNLATGSGSNKPIATFSGSNVVLNNKSVAAAVI